MTDADIADYITSRLTGFHKLIPFIIGAVTIGVCTVNRTLVKCLPHLAIATLLGVIFHCFFTGMGVTAFLISSFAYVAACADASPSIDTFLKITMPTGFGIFWFIDMYVTKVTSPSGEFPVLPYLATVLISALIGIFSVYSVTKFSKDGGKYMMYDFKGCSCDDCAQSNRCSANNVNGATKPNVKQVLMRRV